MKLSQYLEEFFISNKISQKEIEKRTKINQSKLSLIFSGRRKISAIELLIISNEFDIDLEELKKEIKISD